jgi:transcriptional antiterminator RfaH
MVVVTDGGSRWFVAHTLPHREVGAEFQLRQQQFATFLPFHRRTVRHARRFRVIRAPLFPRYLFVELDLGRDRWRAVNGTYGVSGLVMAGELPAPVPRGIVESFMAVANQTGVIDFAATLQMGQKVQMASGPFTDLLGEILATNDAGRVKILLDVMGRRVTTWSAPDAVRPLA